MSHVDEGTLHALVDDQLDAAERQAVEAHLAACGDCARRFAEATAMARQVVTLLGALDAPAMPVVVQPAVVRGPRPAPAPAIAVRARLGTLRRVAMAASVLLVAGVSYQVGRSRDGAPSALERPVAVRLPSAATPMRAVPSVVDGAMDSLNSAPGTVVRAAPRGGPRADGDVAAADRAVGAAAAAAPAPSSPRLIAPAVISPPEPAQQRIAAAGAQISARADQGAERRSRAMNDAAAPAQEVASAQGRMESSGIVVTQVSPPAREARDESVRAAAPAPAVAGASMAKSSPSVPKAAALAGYRTIEEASVPALTRRRYVSPTGTSLELSIAQSFAPAAKAVVGQGTASEFVVTTDGGRSTVRWSAHGMDYVLQGALAPDSLVKLATLLKP